MAGGLSGRGRLGRPNQITWKGSTGALYDSRPNAEWTFRSLGVSIDGEYLRHWPRSQDHLDVYLNGELMLWGDADNPRDIRFVQGNLGTNPGFYFESSRTVNDDDHVTIEL